MDAVTTPEGQMKVSGVLRPLNAVVIDLLLASLVLFTIASILKVEVTANSVFSAIGALVVFSYAFMGYRSLLPSFGLWTLGLKRYSFEDLEEYSGKGTLFVLQCPSIRALALRLLLAGFILAALYATFIFAK